MRRRDFLALGGAALAWPLRALGQGILMPSVGFLFAGSLSAVKKPLDGFRRGLSHAGYIEGQNVNVEYREAQGEYTRLPALAADLASRRVAVIVAVGGIAPAKAAKNATPEIPIVFSSGGDPVKAALVASLNRPGGNVTGVSIIFSELTPKLLDLLRKLTPDTPLVGALVNPKYPEAKLQITELQRAASAAKQPIVIEGADTEGAIGKAFDRFTAHKVSAVLVANDPFFGTRRDQIIMLVTKQRLPAIYFLRDFVEDGGLMSYGPSIVESYRQCGIYAGKILHGARPGDLPVSEPDKLELLINLKAAKALDLSIPSNLLALADEVID